MHRRSSTSDFFPRISSVNHGFDVNNLGLAGQNVGSASASGHGNHTSLGWTGQSSSSVSSHNQVDLEELNAERGRLPSSDANTRISQRLFGERHSQENGVKTLGTGPVTIGSSVSQSSISDAIPENLGLNVAFEDNDGDSDGEVHLVVRSNSRLVGNSEMFERNTRRRITPANEQGFPPSTVSSHIHSANTAQNLQPSYSNGITSPNSGNEESHALVEEDYSPMSPYIPRSTAVQSMIVPGTERRNSGQNPITLRNSLITHSSHNGFAGFQLPAPPGFQQHNVNRGFQNGFNAGILLSSTPPGVPRRNTAEEYTERLSNIVNQSMMRLASSRSEGQQITNHPPSSVRGTLENGVSNVRASQVLPFPMPEFLMMRGEGRNTGLPPILPRFRASFAAQRTTRLLQHALQILNWVDGAALQYEDGLILRGFDDSSDEEEDDLHGDMRLDVDNMSYEELLALEEQIGNVNTGLTDEAISVGMKRRRYESMKLGPPVEEDPCCICQDDYVDGDELGKMNCGHTCHFTCIKKWLLQKNTCPICKKPGVAI